MRPPADLAMAIAGYDGVEAAAAWHNHSGSSGMTTAKLATMLDLARALLDASALPTLTVHTGSRTILVVRETDWTVAAVFPTGHPISKSIRRGMRKLAAGGKGPRPPRVLGETSRESGPLSGTRGGDMSPKVADIPALYRPLRPDERAKINAIAKKMQEEAAADLARAGEYLKAAREAAGNRTGP